MTCNVAFHVRVFLVAVGAALGAVPIAASAHADGVLSGSDTAIIVGGTFESTPTASFARDVEDLYLRPLGFDGGASDSLVCDMVGTDPCSAPLQVLTTPELIQQGHSTLTDASNIVLAVENEFRADPGAFDADHPLTVFGYSQSAAADGIAMARLADAGIPNDDLHFVLLGDPSLPGGAWPNLDAALIDWLGPSNASAITEAFDLQPIYGLLTPDDLYPTTIYTLDGDGAADFQQDYVAGGTGTGGILNFLDHLVFEHLDYFGLTPEQVAHATLSTNGDLTYIDISDDGVNNLAALFGSIEAGLVSGGFFTSLFDSLELAFTNS